MSERRDYFFAKKDAKVVLQDEDITIIIPKGAQLVFDSDEDGNELLSIYKMDKLGVQQVSQQSTFW